MVGILPLSSLEYPDKCSSAWASLRRKGWLTESTNNPLPTPTRYPLILLCPGKVFIKIWNMGSFIQCHRNTLNFLSLFLQNREWERSREERGSVGIGSLRGSEFSWRFSSLIYKRTFFLWHKLHGKRALFLKGQRRFQRRSRIPVAVPCSHKSTLPELLSCQHWELKKLEHREASFQRNTCKILQLLSQETSLTFHDVISYFPSGLQGGYEAIHWGVRWKH